MEEPVTIVDREVLKVLSVDTRMDILKELKEGNRTPSSLGRRLKKSDATIVEHLDVLCKTGLVKKIEQPGKKWVFYTLTDKGYGLVSSKTRRLVVILGTSLLTGAVGLAGVGKYMWEQGRAYISPVPSSYQGEVASKIGETGTAIVSQSPLLLYFSIGLLLLSAVGIGFYIWKKLNVARVEYGF